MTQGTNPCIFCNRGVFKNHRAVECDLCGKWQQILCGNTGVTLVQYREAVKNGSDLNFICHVCEQTKVPEVMEEDSLNLLNQVFATIKNLMPHLAVKSFVADFEAGIWQGLRGAFDEPSIKGCAFHFGQALWRKAQELGLKTTYNSRDEVFKVLRKTFALPLLPAFQRFVEKNRIDSDSLRTFFSYIESTWIESAIWDITSWSVYGRSIRMNNDVEGLHARLNRKAKKANLPFCLLREES